ncbi:MAG: hypothetical protein NZ551_04690 [Microscillaceae bacterium]|nr:hypothetical protein [Microscillaceae bacterium]MDW8460490.1 hypothetical protein [Cytophagales bacterium]
MSTEQSRLQRKPLPECEECIKILQSYLDHETTPEENALVERCLQICSVCREFYEYNKTLIEMVKRLRKTCPEQLAAEIRNKILALQTC